MHQANIITPRLHLIASNAVLTRWERDNHAALASALQAEVAAAWPPQDFRDALEFFARDLDARPLTAGWQSYYWITNGSKEEPRTLIGSGGFKSGPDANGAVEIGYGILPEFQDRGYTTEAVHALVAWAYARPPVALVFAEAFPENKASVRVLEKCGFHAVGPGAEVGATRFEVPRSSSP